MKANAESHSEANKAMETDVTMVSHKLWLTVLLTVSLAVAGCGGGGGGSSPSSGATGSNPPPPSPAPTAQQLEQAAQLLGLATFGPTAEEIDAAAQQGSGAWLNSQFSLPSSHHTPIVERYATEYGADINGDPPPGLYRRFAFWEQAIGAPDQLRQLTAYALTQIFVISDNVDTLFIYPRATSSYYDMLLDHSFGNYRDLLRAVTLHPAMGFYLSHVNNGRSDPVANTFPDENYAREVMQLFSIGLYELNPDGSRILDGNGDPIPTYDNADIREFSKVFTGLSYGPAQPGGPSYFANPVPVMHVPMVMFDAYHEPGEKYLLNGQVVPDGQSGMQDVEDAIDNLFNHPNVGPFIGRQLIQRLVTSNPSPAYVERVSAAFAGSGGSTRGDMRAVITAVLTDPEVADAQRLREPFRRYLALNRSLGASSADGILPASGFVAQFLTQQHVLSAPSVFNFYSPEFVPAGPLGDAGLAAPEFQITDASTIVGMTNLLAYALYGEQSVDTPDGFNPITLNLDPWVEVASDVDALLDRIDLVFWGGELDSFTRSTVREAIEPLDSDLLGRVRLALYISLSSPSYAIAGGNR